MALRPRRTPEQIAAEHQRKANVARARARKLARERETNELIELGKLAKAQGLAGGNRPLEILGKGLVSRVLNEGLLVGGADNLAGLRKLLARYLEVEEWAEFADWWKAQGHPEE